MIQRCFQQFQKDQELEILLTLWELLLFIASIIELLKDKWYDAKKLATFCRVMSDVRKML